jgi:hypothetical protein
MLNIEEIKNTIDELENSPTTFANCQKLSSLYIVLDHIENSLQQGTDAEKDTVKEYRDILPQYKMYREVKRKYQLDELPEKSVEMAIDDVCREIKEFIDTLYSNSDMPTERQSVVNMISGLYNTYSS